MNLAADTVSGYAVNSIAIEVPIAMLTRTGAIEPPTSTAATIGVWATTSRRAYDRASPAAAGDELRRLQPGAADGQSADQRAARWHRLQGPLQHGPAEERRQFATFFLDPALARVINALTAGAVAIPAPPRTRSAAGRDLCAADRGRRHTGRTGRRSVAAQHRRAADASGIANRLGLLGGDPAGLPERPPGVRRRDRHRAAAGGRRRARGTVPVSTSPINSGSATASTSTMHLIARRFLISPTRRAGAIAVTSTRASRSAHRSSAVAPPVRRSDLRATRLSSRACYAGEPSRRFAGTATWISFGIGRCSEAISATNSERDRPARRALCCRS